LDLSVTRMFLKALRDDRIKHLVALRKLYRLAWKLDHEHLKSWLALKELESHSLKRLRGWRELAASTHRLSLVWFAAQAYDSAAMIESSSCLLQ
jgi:hypothetical protein